MNDENEVFSLNLGEMARQKAEREARRTRFSKNYKRFKPRLGSNKLRFMPPWSAKGALYKSNVFTHWNVGAGVDGKDGRFFTCLERTEGGTGKGTCPLCKLVKKLYATKDPMDADMAKKIFAKEGFTANVVNLKDPVYTEEDIEEWKAENVGSECIWVEGETKVQVWNFGPEICGQLDTLVQQGQFDITDIQKGINVVVAGTKPKHRIEYKVSLDPEGPSSFKVVGNLKSKIVNLDSLVSFPDVDVLNEFLEEHYSLESDSGPAKVAKQLDTSTKRRPPALADLEEADEEDPEAAMEREMAKLKSRRV